MKTTPEQLKAVNERVWALNRNAERIGAPDSLSAAVIMHVGDHLIDALERIDQTFTAILANLEKLNEAKTAKKEKP